MLVRRGGIASNSHRVLLLVVVKHVSQDVLRVLETLCHLGVIAIKSLVQWHGRPLSLLVHVGHISVLRVKQDLCVVLEVNLHNLVAETEHNGVLCPHPFLHVHASWRVLQLICLVKKVPLDQLLFFLGVIILLQV